VEARAAAAAPPALLALLHLNVKEIADRSLSISRHHVFKQRERFLLNSTMGSFCA